MTSSTPVSEKQDRSVSVPPAVVVHAGARDRYQVAEALHEGNLLSALVTNVYSASTAADRYGITIPTERVRLSYSAGGAYLVNRVLPRLVPAAISDGWLGTKARQVAAERRDAVLACSYYAFNAFRAGPNRPRQRVLFQLHPHPVTVRRTLRDELENVPEAYDSLSTEPDLSLNPLEFERLASEPSLATGCIAASSHTAKTLIENGVDPQRIYVVPYGISHQDFPARKSAPTSGPFTIIFVGSLIQRKGLKYLLDAVRQLRSKQIRVKLRGRGRFDRRLLKGYQDIELDIALGDSQSRIVENLHASDVFAFPSLEEGFGHVILEAMSCGIPIIATERTCAPDIVEDGRQGFVVPTRDSALLAERLEWAISNRKTMAEMGQAAAARARTFTWERFRQGVRNAYSELTVSDGGD